MRTLALAAALLLASFPSFAQSTFGTILGRISDEKGAVIPAAPITLINDNTSTARSATSNEAGLFEFPDLVVGVYRLEIRREGFKTFVQSGIDLAARQSIRVDPVLQVGAVAETVTVTSSVGLLTTETATISGTVQGGEVFFLSPSSTSQRPWELMRLDPLVQNTNSSTRFTMAGTYYNQAEFQIDGISAPIAKGSLATSMIMSSEALQEVNIQAVNNQAEYASPGVFQEISKGGTNRYHGDAFYNFASSALNARNPTTARKTPTHDHWFGGNIGGPIVIPKLYDGHNKTFFSLSWQSERNPSAQVYTASVPSPNMRAGIFGAAVRDPLTGLPFPNNTVPASRYSAVSRYFQDTFFPLPNLSGASNNFQLVGPAGTTRQEVVDGRIDERINNRNWLFGRVGMTQFNNRGYDSNLPTIGFRANTRKLFTGVLSYTATIQPSLLNEARLGFVRDNLPTGGSNNGLEVVQAAGIHFPGDIPVPDARGFPVMQVTGLQTLMQQNSGKSISQSYQFTDTLSWMRGRHTVKTGINIFAEQPNTISIPSGSHGSFRFQGAYTGQAYADFLLGIPDQTTVAGVNPGLYTRNTNYGLFVQDDFKVLPNLTLSFGLRWDYQGAIYNKNDVLYNFDPATGGLIKGSPATPVNAAFAAKYPQVKILEASAVGLPSHTLHFADKNNFVPRLGFAWRPGNSSNFAVRGGYGIYTDILGGGVLGQFGTGGFLSSGSLSFDNARLSAANILPATAFQFPNPFPTAHDMVAAPGLTAAGFNPHLRNPYVQQWNVSVERAVFNIALRASYVATKSTNLVYQRDINQRLVANDNNSRPYVAEGFTSNILYMDNGGSQIYHSMELKATRKLQRGLMFQAGYVFGKNLSDVIDGSDQDYTNPQSDARSRAIDRGRIGYNRDQNFTAFALWELPFGKGRRWMGTAPSWLDAVLGGWQLYPQFYSGTGQWFSPQRQTANPFTGLSGETSRADRIGDGNDGPKQTGVSTFKWIDTSAFVQPPANRLGNAGRNILEGPGFYAMHLGLTKKFRFLETREFWISATAQNFLNHPNWASPSSSGELTVGQAAFGSTSSLISTDRGSVASARLVMLRARIVF